MKGRINTAPRCRACSRTPMRSCSARSSAWKGSSARISISRCGTHRLALACQPGGRTLCLIARLHPDQPRGSCQPFREPPGGGAGGSSQRPATAARKKSSAIPVEELGHLPSYRETNRSITDFKDALQHDTRSYWEARHAEDQASRCLVGSEYADE